MSSIAHRTTAALAGLLLVTTLAACDQTPSAVDTDSPEATTPATSDGPVRVMPLGDSITEGYRNDVTWRWFLWQQLLDAGYQVDFVGSQRGAYRGRPKLRDFDQDHEGHWGWQAQTAARRAERWAREAQPDVVLVHLGTNDLASRQGVPRTRAALGRIVAALRRANPSVTVLLAQLIPLDRRERLVVALNDEIAELAGEESTAQSPVVVVDQFTRFDVDRMSDDGIHPNVVGQARMADRWYAALAPVLDRLGGRQTP